jgi:hypothetical protein
MVVVAVWALDETLGAISAVVVAGNIGVCGCNVSEAAGSSGCERRGWVLSWGVVG